MNKVKFMILFSAVALFAGFNLFLKIKIRLYRLKSNKVKKNVRLAFLSDLHSCYYGKDQRELLDIIDNQKPDVILMGGDIIDNILPQKNAITVLKALSKKYRCFYVSGNHEIRTGRIEDIKSIVRSMDITVLDGDCRCIDVNGEKINICGADDKDIGAEVLNSQLEYAEKKKDKSIYSVLICHRPELIDLYLKYDYDLILSGHAHGGQWRLPGFINGLYAPGQGIFPKYAGGKYVFGETDFIVGRGLSREKKIIPRIFNNPELVIIEIGNKAD